MEQNEIISKIRSVLINDCTPVGIGDNPNLIDEYEDYIGLIMKILKQKPLIDEIVMLLKKIENTEMGVVDINIDHLWDVAMKLREIGVLYYKYSE